MPLLTQTFKARLPHWIPIALISLLGSGIYSGAIQGGFKWDDHILIEDDRSIKTWSDTAGIFFKPLYRFKTYYRPLQTLSYKLDYAFWGMDPKGYHFTNIFLHIFNAALVYLLFSQISRSRISALFGALIFTCHPALAEPVNYISSRSDLLVAAFTLLVFIFYNFFNLYRKKKYYAYSLLCLALSLLCKESAIVLPFVILGYECLFWKKFKRTLPFFAVAIVFILFRGSFMPARTEYIFNPSGLLSLPRGLLNYIAALAFPHGLYKTWRLPLENPAGLTGFFTGIGLLCIFGYAAVRISKRSKEPLFGLAWTIITLAPFLLLIFFYPPFLSGYSMPFSFAWLYTPSIGSFLYLTALTVPMTGAWRKKTYALAAFIVLVLCALTISYNKAWTKPETEFFHGILRQLPASRSSKGIQTNLGLSYMSENKFDAALPIFLKAMEEDPRDTEALFNLGSIYLSRNELDKALAYYRQALSIDPSNPKIHYNIALIHIKNNEIDAAIKELEMTAVLEPMHADAHYNLAILYAQKSSQTQALREYEILKSIEPGAFRTR